MAGRRSPAPHADDGAAAGILHLVTSVLDLFLDAAGVDDLDIVAMDLNLRAVGAGMLGNVSTLVVIRVVIWTVVISVVVGPVIAAVAGIVAARMIAPAVARTAA